MGPPFLLLEGARTAAKGELTPETPRFRERANENSLSFVALSCAACPQIANNLADADYRAWLPDYAGAQVSKFLSSF